MKFNALLLMAATITKVFSHKAQNTTTSIYTENFDSQDASVSSWIAAQQINCEAAKEIVIMADLSGLGDVGWNNYVIPSMQKLARSFDISTSATRFEIFNRYSTTYNGYWCIPIELFSNVNSNVNSLVAAIQNMPCNVLSPIGIATLFGVLYGSRRPNTPVEILLLTDWTHHNSGVALYEVDRIKEIGGIRFLCAGVGSAVDYGYLASICGSNIIKITNYAAIKNSVDQIANNLCNGINTPTTPAPTSLAPSSKITTRPTNIPTNKTPSPIVTFRPTTFGPSKAPTKTPTNNPTKAPTNYPTQKRRTKYPTKAPTNYPTKKTTVNPSVATDAPTNTPTVKRSRRLVAS